jgi:hypothetical protein
MIPDLKTEFTITATSSAGGAVSGGGKTEQGADAVLIIKPDKGYEISGIGIDGKTADLNSLTDNRDGTWTLKIHGVAADHIVKIEFRAVSGPSVPEATPILILFSDVSENAWYRESVRFVTERGLFNGTGNGRFSPQLNMTRSMFVAVLGRLSGSVDGGTYTAAFSDTDSGSWYMPYISWASANGIVSGYGNGTFGPDDNVSREQMALFLYRYAKTAGFDVNIAPGSNMAGSRFIDADEISPWAQEAVDWAVNAGLINGRPGNVFDPEASASRAEVAAMIHRFAAYAGLIKQQE